MSIESFKRKYSKLFGIKKVSHSEYLSATSSEHVKRYTTQAGGETVLWLTDGSTVTISERK